MMFWQGRTLATQLYLPHQEKKRGAQILGRSPLEISKRKITGLPMTQCQTEGPVLRPTDTECQKPGISDRRPRTFGSIQEVSPSLECRNGAVVDNSTGASQGVDGPVHESSAYPQKLANIWLWLLWRHRGADQATTCWWSCHRTGHLLHILVPSPALK